MSRQTDTDYDLDDAIRESLIEAAYLPLEKGSPDHTDDELALTARDIRVLDYYVDRRWEAFRLEPIGEAIWATLARWSEEGIEILAIDRNGVEHGHARFDYTAQGARWAAAAINA
jgi:hypothetical protein